MGVSAVFTLLPTPVAILVFSSIFQLSASHALPRQTTTIDSAQINVQPWPLATAAPDFLDELLPRQRRQNTICGYIGGDPDLPATCSAGSHCAADVVNSVVGCCPDGGSCTQGIFTGCVDGNSEPQTEINPYVYTCGGSDLCYRNSFDGGFHQFGCGTASGMGSNVATSASDRESLVISALSAELTAEPTPLSEPTTLGTVRRTRTTDKEETTETLSTTNSRETSTDTTDTRPTDTAPTNTATSTAASDAEAPDAEGSDRNTGAIIGGIVAGVAVFIAMVAVGVIIWHRRRKNKREGPGPNGKTEYISPAAGDNHAFQPVASQQPEKPSRADFGLGPSLEEDSDEQDITAQSRRHFDDYENEYAPEPTTTGVTAVGGSGTHMEADRVPLTREIDDFSRGYSAAVGDYRETSLDENGVSAEDNPPGTYPGLRSGNSGRPLWQQNRRQSRNLMWM